LPTPTQRTLCSCTRVGRLPYGHVFRTRTVSTGAITGSSCYWVNLALVYATQLRIGLEVLSQVCMLALEPPCITLVKPSMHSRCEAAPATTIHYNRLLLIHTQFPRPLLVYQIIIHDFFYLRNFPMESIVYFLLHLLYSEQSLYTPLVNKKSV
jgi:hypothetical protein